MQEEVSLASTVPDGDTDDLSEIMALAVQEVEHCARVTDDSLPKICSEMEGATSELMIRPVFRRFNFGHPEFSEVGSSGKVQRAYLEGAQPARGQSAIVDVFGQPGLYRGGYPELQVIHFARASSLNCP